MAQRHSHAYHDGMERGRELKGRGGILKSASGSARLANQVDELHGTLYDTNCTMAENERMLSEYRDVTHSQSREMDILRDELERSREVLRMESDRSRHHPSVTFDPHQTWLERQHLELERERMARERAEQSSSRMLDLLNTSLKATTPVTEQRQREELHDDIRGIRQELSASARAQTKDDVIDKLAEEIRHIKEDLWKRDVSERQQELQKDVKVLESDLAAERHQLSTSLHESHKLASQVDRLGTQLDQVNEEKQKALSQLEATTRRLDESLGGREELLRCVKDLQLQLSRSEECYSLLQERHTSLQQQYRQQELTHERLSSQIRNIETLISQHRSEQSSLEDRYEEVKQRLLQSSAAEQKLQERCEQLQAKLAEKVEERECLQRRVSLLDRESSESKMEATQLKVDIRDATAERNALQEHVHSLEQEVYRGECVQERLNQELREVFNKLSASEEKRGTLVAQLEETMKKLQHAEEEKQTLQSKVVELEKRVQKTERRGENTHSQALQALKKYKLCCRQLEQEKLQLSKAKEETIVHCEALQQQLQEYHSHLENNEACLTLLKEENTELKSRMSDLQAQNDQHKQQFDSQTKELESSLRDSRRDLEKYQRDFTELQSQNDSLAAERMALKQELLRSQEQQIVAEEGLSNLEEHNKSETMQLQHDLQASQTQSSKALSKLKKLSKAYQTVKAELASLRSEESQWVDENSRLVQELEQVQHASAQKEQEMCDHMETLKISHGQELEHMQQKLLHTSAKLEQKVTQLQLQLADEESRVRAVRRQQFRTLGDHQKMGEDLSKSMEDTEKLRLKYLRSKRFYKEKAAALENELTAAQNEENMCLRQQLADSQTSLVLHVKDHETILKTIGEQVDALVQKMGRRVRIPVFTTVAGDETDTRKWIADMLAKLQWLRKETEHVLLLERKLKRKQQEQCERDHGLQQV